MHMSSALLNTALVNQSALAASSTVTTGINLPYPSGTRFLHEILVDTAATARFANIFADVRLPSSPQDFQRTYRHAVMHFEGARTASPDRTEIATHLAGLSQERMVYVDETGKEIPLLDYMLGEADPLPIATIEFSGAGLMPRISYGNTTHQGEEIISLASDFADRHMASHAATDALQWIIENGRDENGHVNLKGQKFAILGAGAELSPTQVLLEAGADVLWIDLNPPSEEFLQRPGLSGSITFVPERQADLLNRPREIAETIEKFADGQAVNIGTFAYAAGSGLEWRLTTAMNVIVRRLRPETIKSYSTFISPTSPAVTQPDDLDAARAGVRVKHMLVSAARLFGRLRPNHHPYGNIHMADTIVPLQKTGYQGAQYIEKVCAAEAIAAYGNRMDRHIGHPVTVSANVAGISQTKNMQIPAFQLGFIGAPAFGLETYQPETTRWLSGLIMLSDLLNEASPATPSTSYRDEQDRARALFSRQVHGGIFAHPYALNELITLAGLVGAKRNLRLAARALAEQLKGGKKKKG